MRLLMTMMRASLSASFPAERVISHSIRASVYRVCKPGIVTR
jgi:hypothetical protein